MTHDLDSTLQTIQNRGSGPPWPPIWTRHYSLSRSVVRTPWPTIWTRHYRLSKIGGQDPHDPRSGLDTIVYPDRWSGPHDPRSGLDTTDYPKSGVRTPMTPDLDSTLQTIQIGGQDPHDPRSGLDTTDYPDRRSGPPWPPIWTRHNRLSRSGVRTPMTPDLDSTL